MSSNVNGGSKRGGGGVIVSEIWVPCYFYIEKESDLTQKSPYTSRNVKRAKWYYKQRPKKIDYTAIADRLRIGFMVTHPSFGSRQIFQS